MSAADTTTSLTGQISLRFVELCQFRRLGKVQLEVDPKTTILVGANNSGKTSILAALRISSQMARHLVLSTSVFLNGQNCGNLEELGTH